jgi:ketosteroid isomerase-like protein
MKRRMFLSLGGALAATPIAGTLFAAQGPKAPQAGAGHVGAASKAEAEVRQAEKDRFAAMVKADVTALDKLLAPELTYTHGDARVIDKAAFLADFKSGAFKYVTIDPSDTKVRLFGDTAVVTGGAAMHVVQNGADAHIKIRYTDVHVRRNGSWQMVAWEATRLPQ